MPMGGGDPDQLTKIGSGVQQYAWRPDGSALAFAASDEAPKKTGEEKFDDAFEVRNNDYLVNAQPLPTHLWLISTAGLIPTAGGEAKRLTQGAWSLPVSHPPSSPASPIAWSPDGKSIAFVKIASPYSGDADQSTLQVMDLATGEYHAVTGRAKNEGYPAFSPDGSHLAYWYPRGGEPRNGNEIFVVAGTRGEGSDATLAINRNLYRGLWMPDGKSLLVGGNDGTSVGLWIQPLSGAAKRLQLGDVCPTSTFWIDAHVGAHGEVAFTGSEPAHPSELYYLPSADAPLQRLTSFNSAFDAMELGKSESIQWNTPGGSHSDGVLTYPPDFAKGRKYPLVLYIHGGPRSASKRTFSVWAQMLAAKGWVVFEPNYRGSDNLGNEFQTAIWNDAGEGPGKDVMGRAW